MSREVVEPDSTATSRPVPDVWVVRLAALVFISVLALANASLVKWGPHSRSGGEALMIINVLAMVLGLAGMSTVKRISRGAILDSYVIAVVFGPPAVWAYDGVIMTVCHIWPGALG
jgi:hypothetical protein